MRVVGLNVLLSQVLFPHPARWIAHLLATKTNRAERKKNEKNTQQQHARIIRVPETESLMHKVMVTIQKKSMQ